MGLAHRNAAAEQKTESIRRLQRSSLAVRITPFPSTYGAKRDQERKDQEQVPACKAGVFRAAKCPYYPHYRCEEQDIERNHEFPIWSRRMPPRSKQHNAGNSNTHHRQTGDALDTFVLNKEDHGQNGHPDESPQPSANPADLLASSVRRHNVSRPHRDVY